jgi:hypothetical protein
MPLSRLLTLIAVLSFAVWIALAFVWPMPSGWVHVFLVTAVFVIVRAIVAADGERAGRS